MAITFAVDDVAPAAAPAVTVSLAELVGDHRHLGLDPALPVLLVRGTHPLLAAVHYAFAEHRSLVLSPDVVWLTIAYGVAQHVRLHAAALRSRLVRHEGRRVLEVAVDAFPANASDWAELVGAFRVRIADTIGDGVARLLTCDFSTTGDVERTASEIVLMDTVSSYFDYLVTIVCGIPTITLLGTPGDWRAIRARIDVIAELDLGFWTASLAPIVDRLVAAAEGRPDTAFFREIYKPQRAYGWDRIAGWIARFYPYVGQAGSFTERNPLLALALDAELPRPDRQTGYYDGPGIRTEDVPAGPSQVLVRMKGGAEDLIVLEGGVLAVEQDADGRLVPRAGFVVRGAEHGVAALVERIRAEHVATPGHDDPAWQRDGAVRALFAAIGEARLFVDTQPWHLLPVDRRELVELARKRHGELRATRVVDLPDGTFVAITDSHPSWVVRLRSDALGMPEPIVPDVGFGDDGVARTREPEPGEPMVFRRTTEHLQEIPVVSTSLVVLLARALATGGDLALPVVGALLDHLPDFWDTPHHAAPLLERLRRDHHVVLTDEDRNERLFGRVEEAVVRVGDDVWTTLPAAQRQRIRIRRRDAICEVTPRIRLPDDTILAEVSAWPEQRIVRLRLDAITETVRKPATATRAALIDRTTSETADTIPVVGRSLVEIITRALDTGALPPSTGLTLDSWFQQRVT